jgi:glycogen synthase
MIRSSVDAHVHFKHTSEEVAALADAIVPLHDNILAVSTPYERGMMRKILNGHYFRQRDADRMRDMLIRAVKHSRANLADYFPMMRQGILEQALHLENTVNTYWADFIAATIEAQPTH